MTDDLRDFVVELSKTTIDEQRDEIEKICSESTSKAIALAIEALNVIKSSDVDLVKSNKSFLDSCGSAIDTLQAIVDGGKITKAKKEETVKAITLVLMKANSYSITTKIYKDECLPCLTVLGLVATTLPRH